MGRRSFAKGMLTGIILTVFLFSTLSAAPVKKTIEIFTNNIKLVVDGRPVTPKDASGNVVELFSYNGTTYLPVRAVGEAIGREVIWDQKTYTVHLGKKKIGEAIGLGTLVPYEAKGDLMFNRTNNGKAVINKILYPITSCLSLKNSVSKLGNNQYDAANAAGYAVYKLNGNYAKLTGKFGIDDESGEKLKCILTIHGDDEVLLNTELSKGDPIEVIDVDLVDVTTLRISLTIPGYTTAPNSNEGADLLELYANMVDLQLYEVAKQ